MIKYQNNEIVKLLAIGAHPDDIDIAAGGTISKWVNDGVQIHYCIVSDGDAGSPDPNILASEAGKIRRLEQKKAAEKLGVKTVHFLGLPDGQIEPSLELRMKLAVLIRQIKPKIILTHAPIFNLNSIRFSHPDHLAVGQAVISAVFPDARNPNAFRGTELIKFKPHSVETVWMMGAPTPNTYEEITDFITIKIDAIQCHTSQLGDYGDVHQFFYSWGRELASDAGYCDDRLAEAFYVMDTR